ncbi:hypothetical protein [Antarctobacter jejuensis]|uniref:hypothetical protein n=1 Tax=Antarctobacter jejuensis TaxID=1439938 RepID=UPI003FD436C3
MTPDEWQAHVTRAAAREIGKWLEARGRLDRPIASLGLSDLDAMASRAIGRYLLLSAQRPAPPADPFGLDSLLMG